MSEILDIFGDFGVSVLLATGSLLAVWVPFWRGVRLCRRARAATRRVDPAEIGRRRRRGDADRGESLGLHLLRVADQSLRELRSAGAHEPRSFVLDAARQHTENEYDTCYARPISMYANILPPIGFIGTPAGLLILFLSMRLSSGSLELGALALALTSTLFALIGFAALESLKIRLYGRLLGSLDDALRHVPALSPVRPPARSGPRAVAAAD